MGQSKPETNRNRIRGRGRETSALEMVLSPFPDAKAGTRKLNAT
jgi:hypothetical protein